MLNDKVTDMNNVKKPLPLPSSPSSSPNKTTKKSIMKVHIGRERSNSTPPVINSSSILVPEKITEGEYEDDEGYTTSITSERYDYIVQLFREKACDLIQQRKYEMEKNGKYASLCVIDAFEGRLSNGLATNFSKSRFIFAIYQLQTSFDWMNIVILSSAFHSILIFLEPNIGYETCEDTIVLNQNYYNMIAPYIFYLHYIVWIIHGLDSGMKIFYQGVKEYFNHDWQRLYFIAIAMHFLDLCLCGQTHYTNPLRPVVCIWQYM